MTETEAKATIEKLHRKYAGVLFDHCFRLLGSKAAAEDALQEVFLSAYRGLASFTYGESHLPWLYRIATNLATSRLRKRRAWRWISLEGLRSRASPNPGAEELVADAEQRDRVRRAIESLPMDLRKVVVLCELAGLGYQQVADALKIPVGTVGSRRHRAVEMLRRKLGGG